MELTIFYRIFRIHTENSFGHPSLTLIPVQDGDNKFDSEAAAIQWVEEREGRERYTEFVILPTYTMI